MTPICKILVVTMLVAVVAAFDPSAYTGTAVLSSPDESDYTLYWKVSEDKSSINLAIRGQTTGWIGFGLGDPKSGSMPGADMIVGYVVDGKARVEDRYATEFNTPHLDDCQDWDLVKGEETTDGYTIIEVTRKIIANNTIQDRSILPGVNMVVWAMGSTDTFGFHDHGHAFDSVEFWPDPDAFKEPLDGSKHLDLLISNVTIPDVTTSYVNEVFVVPYLEEGPAHIIQIDPIVNNATKAYVHHYFVYACENITDGAVQHLIGNPQPSNLFPSTGCNQQIFAWGLGGNSLYLPLEAGFLMNNSADGIRFLLIQIHYNNPNQDKGQIDSSGLRITWTKTMRPNNAGMLMFGDPYLRGKVIPPGIEKFAVEYTCPAACTSQWKHPITVFADFLHMHEIGIMAWGTRWSSDSPNADFLGNTNRAEYFAFDRQQITPVKYVMQPGERVNSHCIWNSMGRTNTTLIGKETVDEMCAETLFYYPALFNDDGTPFQLCALSFSAVNQTFCGSNKILISAPQPVVPEPPGGEIQQFGQEQNICSADSSSTTAATTGSSKSSASVVSLAFISAVLMVVIHVL